MDARGISWKQLKILERSVIRKKIERVEQGEMKPFPEAETVLKQIERPKAVVSNAYDNALDQIIRFLGFDRYLEYWIAPSISDIENYRGRMKPGAEMLVETMEHLGSRNCLMVGDSEVDIIAAKNAGIDSVLIGDKNFNSTYSIDSLEELIPIVRQS